ncbi:hypothetical protein PpBr36_07447 [Pyricularia pennisetigena]|uniref:hypothetical protein n=1 Tax=Pyricularia pennisetigena TaxID=1578925 RepID=UPI00114E1AFB|nr:hypothetical protein PpBr36_07447 [Pyricularia pennisetigena]TLS26074.1 hypothetical protein PpBr36_07447 [Pyricularia pennisetigena]
MAGQLRRVESQGTDERTGKKPSRRASGLTAVQEMKSRSRVRRLSGGAKVQQRFEGLDPRI